MLTSITKPSNHAEPVATQWQTFGGKRVIVQAPPNSYALKRAPAELRQAERATEALEKLLAPPADKRGAPIVIYLADSVAGADSDGGAASSSERSVVRGETIVRMVAPDAPAEPIAYPLARLLIRRWFGDDAAQAELWIEGIAGIVAARTKTGLSLDDAKGQVIQQLAAGRPISLTGATVSAAGASAAGASAAGASAAGASAAGASAAGASAAGANGKPMGAAVANGKPDRNGAPPTAATSGVAAVGGAPDAKPSAAAATAFLAHVLEKSSAGSLHTFLSEYDPKRRDHAAIRAFQRPLATLESAWQMSLRGAARKVDYGAFVRQIWPLIKPYKWRQVEVLFYVFLVAGFTQVMPLATQFLVNSVTAFFTKGQSNPTTIITNFALILGGVYLANSLVVMRQAYVTNWLNQHILVGLQGKMFAHLQRLSHSFYANARVGDLMSRLSSDLQIVNQAMSQVTTVGIQQLLVCLLSAGNILFQTAKAGVPLLGVLTICIIPLFALSFFALRARFQQASQEQQKSMGESTNAVQENLSAHAVIKAFNLEASAEAAYRMRLAAQLKASLRLVVLGALSSLNVQMTMAFGQLIVLCVGGWYVLQNPNGMSNAQTGMTLGTLIMLPQLLSMMLAPVAGLAGVGQSVSMASGALDRTNELFDEPVAVADSSHAVALPPLARSIQLENVSFSYGGDQPILRDLNFTIAANTHVAVVGPSGSGKSTLVNLLLRFWDPETGCVRFDDHDLREVTLNSLRAQIGFVFQDTFVFDTTLRENIGLGRPGATDDEIKAAAHAARLDEFVAGLPAGYDTVLGERGVRMSGGQRQRIAIARALLRDPRLLILDEATSALDARTEREILSTLDTLAQGRTTLSITHRLASAARADRILVMDQGELVESGTHDELMAQNGLYRRLYQEQVGGLTEGVSQGQIEAERLKAIPLFGSLDAPALQKLAGSMTLERLSQNTDVVVQGEPGDRLYFVSQGQAEALADGQRVNLLSEGDYFGEMALLSEQPRTATVRALGDLQLYSLGKREFEQLIETAPAIGESVQQTIAARRAVLDALPGAE